MNRVNNIETRILKEEIGIAPDEVIRFTTGYCHSVFYIKSKPDEYVLRITEENAKEFYAGSVKWLPELAALGVSVPKIIKHGSYEDKYYSLLSFIPGKDLGDVYCSLNDLQKQNIVKKLAAIQRKVATLPPSKQYGYAHATYGSFNTWLEFLGSCINNGELSGIVDVDEICYGDPLFVIGLTNMALLSMQADTKYIDYWLDEIGATDEQRRAVMHYTLLFCVDFMGEQGMLFGNDNTILYNEETATFLSSLYFPLFIALIQTR